jgi:hypothetical protein
MLKPAARLKQLWQEKIQRDKEKEEAGEGGGGD